MRTRWEFMFEHEDLNFEKPSHFVAKLSKDEAKQFAMIAPSGLTAQVKIESEVLEHEKIKQRGKIHITIPGLGEETKNLAYHLAGSISHQITFALGRIDIIGSFISYELIPETDTEAAEIGENRYSIFMNLVEVPPRIPFDGSVLKGARIHPLLIQFNNADKALSAIDRFIGFFKILENLYGPRSREGLAKAFKNSNELRLLALENLVMMQNGQTRPIKEGESENLFDELVSTRHQCAHLSGQQNFGITYGDPKVEEVVEPLLIPLRILASAAVEKRIRNVK